ncbi:MAG: 23S rRNA (uracil(1939)-C(5))-methyltransferase RlmD, partial [Lachnospiraceae bacterium]|nr:23S rRNA (uracil(1939)-C(5))-methyltransferase RlmD [Lachnospiraceae bacterium]
MFQKNMELELLIEDLGVDGEGIGKAEGAAFFVKDAVVGDRVLVKIMKMKKRYGYARLLKVLSPSPYRTKPLCDYYRQCGGCQLQVLEYAQQLQYKERKVRNNLERIGGFRIAETEYDKQGILFHPMIGMEEPFFYRNKAQFPVGTDKEGNIVTGFYAARSHNIIPNRRCCLGADLNEKILDIVISFMERYHISAYDEASGAGLVRHVLIRYGFVTGEIMVCLVINGINLPMAEKLTAQLQKIPGMTSILLNVNKKQTNVILGSHVINLWGQDYITDYIGSVKYQISPLSFYQVNPVQTKKLYETVLAYAGLTGRETVWDLYCGIGTISLFLAQQSNCVYGVEIVAPAIEDARNNARINGIENVEFFVGKAEEVFSQWYEREKIPADVIVVDPPRKGCDIKCLETIVNMQPERVVYVSCDSATLARDLKYLCERGYELKEVQPVDMFPQTTHVETVVQLSQQKPDDVIEVDLDLDELDITASETKATYQEIKEYVLEKYG